MNAGNEGIYIRNPGPTRYGGQTIGSVVLRTARVSLGKGLGNTESLDF